MFRPLLLIPMVFLAAADLGGELVLYADSPHCFDNPQLECLFSEMAWAVRLDDGRFRLPSGAIVEDVD